MTVDADVAAGTQKATAPLLFRDFARFLSGSDHAGAVSINWSKQER